LIPHSTAWRCLAGPTRTDDPRDILREEDVEFDPHGHANPAQRITTEELAHLTGTNPDDLPEPQPDLPTDPSRRMRRPTRVYPVIGVSGVVDQ
jgi:hypothetical protein